MQKPNANLSNHIQSVSATMVGACLTVVSVIQLVSHTAISPRADDFLAIDGVAFLIGTLLS